MSVVTNIVFFYSSGENPVETIDKINEYLKEKYDTNLVSINDPILPKKWYGGYKYFEAELYLAAINAFNETDFLAFVSRLKWEEPEFVQLIVKRDQEEQFSIVHLSQNDN